MGVTTTKTNKPFNPRAQDASPLAYNRAALYSGKALSFDGVNDYVASSAFSLDTSEWSASMILKNDTAVSDQVFFTFSATGSNDESFIIYNNFANSNKISFYGAAFTGSPVIFDYVIPTDYEHLTFTFANNTLSLYVNGVFVDSGSVTGNDGTQTASAIVGARRLSSYVQFFNGQVSGLKMYSTALTPAQIADLYNNPEKIVPTGVDNTALKLWLPMMESAGTTAYDGSGNGNHGTINGATYVNGIGASVAQTSVIDWNKGDNLTPYSEDFSAYSRSGVNLTSNQLTSPNGLFTGTKGLETTANAYRDLIGKTFSPTASNSYTLSAFVKGGLGRDGVYLYTNDGSGNGRLAKFNLSTGAYIGNAGAGGWTAFDSYGIEVAPNGWYRIHGTLNSSLGSTRVFNVGLSDNTNDALGPYVGDAAKGLYVWGYQFQQTAAVSPYTPTIGTAQTTPVLLPAGLTTGRDITGVNLFENVRKQGALNLDGSSWSEVHDNASLDVTTAVTLEAWVYWDGSNSSKGILGRWFSGNASYMLYANNSTTLYFFINTSSSAATISGTGWKHIVGTYDSIKRRVYIDGQEIGSGDAYNATIDVNDKPIEIGRYAGNTAYEYDGPIAQPRIYNRALTASEVQKNYNAGKNIYS